MSLENVEIRTLTLLLSLLALGALGLVACDGGEDEDSATEVSPEQAIEQAGNEWAASFAAGGPGASCGRESSSLRITVVTGCACGGA